MNLELMRKSLLHNMEEMDLREPISKSRLTDSELPNDPALHYKFWTHEEVMHWLRGLNEEFYAQYAEQFESSQLDGRTFEAMSNVLYLKEAFSMQNEAALALADVVLNRIQVLHMIISCRPQISSIHYALFFYMITIQHHKQLDPHRGQNSVSSSQMTENEEKQLLDSFMKEVQRSNSLSKEALKISNSKWRQLRCSTYVMRYSARWIRAIYGLIGVIFLTAGVLTYLKSESVVRQEFTAYNQMSDCSLIDGDYGKECTVDYTLDHDFQAPVYFYYKLTNFYQNHRSYVKSLSVQQIHDDDNLLDPKSSRFCTPSEVHKANTPLKPENNGLLMLPCGLIANSFFNDKFKVNYIEEGEENEFCDDSVQCEENERNEGDGSSWTQWTDSSWFASPNWEKQGIAWKSDVNHKFRFTDQIDGETTNINTRQYEQGVTLPDIDDEDFMVWMRTSTKSTFTKLHRIIGDQSLKKGAILRVTIRNYFAVDDFHGTKSIVISTNSSLGGKNTAMPILFMAVGCVCFGMAFFFRLLIPRNRCASFNRTFFETIYVAFCSFWRLIQGLFTKRDFHRKQG